MLGAGATRAAEVGMLRFCRSLHGQRREATATRTVVSRRCNPARYASTSWRSARLAARAVVATMALRRAPSCDSSAQVQTRSRKADPTADPTDRGLSEVIRTPG